VPPDRLSHLGRPATLPGTDPVEARSGGSSDSRRERARRSGRRPCRVGGIGDADFRIPGPPADGTISGSFQGADGGAGDAIASETPTTWAGVLTTGEGASGLKVISLTAPVSGWAVSLG
jgi:hypothetical protein